MRFSGVEPPYASAEGCRLVWLGPDDEQHAVLLGGEETASLVEVLRRGTAGKVRLADGVSEAIVNSDVVQFALKDRMFEAGTDELRRRLLEYARVPHEPQYSAAPSREFYPSARPSGGGGAGRRAGAPATLHEAILSQGGGGGAGAGARDLFRVMAARRSTRRFAPDAVEDWKVDKILAAADTAPTAGNFQGFQVFYVRDPAAKRALAEAANNQPYVDAPVVLAFCMEPSRVRMDFPPGVLEKFSLQDATLAAAYSQLAASALGLSSIWIGMIDEARVMSVLGTGLRPSSLLCIGYPARRRPPRPRRKLKDLIRVVG